jgi:heat shock protein HslJ
MTDDPGAGPDDSSADALEIMPQGPPEKMNPGFYAALVLIGILVLMVVIVNYPAARANAGVTMTRTNWTLQSYTDATGIHIPVITGSDVTARFDSGEGRMSGRSGCNWYSALYSTKDYTITLSPESKTDMGCYDTGIMEQESAFLADLSKVSSFRVSESALKFYDAAGKVVLVFVPA